MGIFAYDKNAINYIDSNINLESGIYVAKISKDGAADKSKLQEGDIIQKIDGIEINKMSELKKYIYTKKVGEEVNIKIIRNGKQSEIKIKLGKKI